MGLPASPRIILPVLGFFLLALFLWDSGSTGTMSSSTSSSSASFDPSKALSLSVSTTSSSSHPTIKLSVTNTASSPVTFLRWNTPLDPMALKVGVLSLTAQGSSEPAQLAIIAVRRMMPPQADQFITLGPGETATNEQELKPPVVMPEELGIKDKTVKVQAIGEWSHVWPLGHEDVINHHREKVGGAESDGAARGSFMSEPLDVQF